MKEKTGVSRRSFMRNAAVAAAAPTALAGAATSHASAADVLVAATVVRASHSRDVQGALKIGVRASVVAEGFSRDNIVVTVDGVRFGATADVTRDMITAAVQQCIAQEMATSGSDIAADRIAVQVFGGVL